MVSSTRAIDVAIIPLDPETVVADGVPAVTLRSAPLSSGYTHEQRLRQAAQATVTLTTVWIEEPWTRMWPTARALFTLDGAITTGASARGRAVTHLQAASWKKQLGLRQHGKDPALNRARAELEAHGDRATAARLNHDQADALCIALAGRDLCWKAIT